MRTLVLILFAVVAHAQNLHVFPRWQEQAIITDLTKARYCDSVTTAQARLINYGAALASAQEGKIVVLDSIGSEKNKQIQLLTGERDAEKRKNDIYKAQAIKAKRQRNVVVAAVVVVEVLKFIFSSR